MDTELPALVRPPFDEAAIISEAQSLIVSYLTRLCYLLSQTYKLEAMLRGLQEVLSSGYFGDCVRTLVRFVNHPSVAEWDPDLKSTIADCYDFVLSIVADAPAAGEKPSVSLVPAKYQIGALLRWVDIYLHPGLINYSTAARLLYDDFSLISRKAAVARVRRLVERGRLSRANDLGTSNPRHAQRVRREEVEAVRAALVAQRDASPPPSRHAHPDKDRKTPRERRPERSARVSSPRTVDEPPTPATVATVQAPVETLSVSGGYGLGDRVRHPRFGAGTVVGLREADGDLQVTVEFAPLEQRIFKASLAMLEHC